MNPLPSSEHDEQDGDRSLEDLGAVEVPYPADLLAARRAAFLKQVEKLTAAKPNEELSSADQEIVRLLGTVKSTQTVKHSAFVRRIEIARRAAGERIRVFIQRIFQKESTTPNVPPAGLIRASLIVASLVAALFLGSSWFARAQASFTASLSQVAVMPTAVPSTSTSAAVITLCDPDDPTSSCPPGKLDPDQDLANTGNGAASPAVSKDAHPAHLAKYVNDGHGGVSWVSRSPDSWNKLDLGQVRTINTVSLEKGTLVSSDDSELGSFVIAVALSDVYADGDSSNDYKEYSEVFDSKQAGVSGMDLHTEMITTRFSPVEARFVKITFEKAGAAIEEVGVFMAEPPVLAGNPTRIPRDDVPGVLLIPTQTNTMVMIYTSTSVPTLTPTNTQVPSHTPEPSDTPTQLPTNTQAPTNTSEPSDTPTSLPTRTKPPVDTSTPVPTTIVPTLVPLTAIQTAAQISFESSEPVVVTGSNQTLTVRCNGTTAEIRGHENTVTLLGSCNSITVTGNGNHVFWQSGSPVIMMQGQDNIVSPL